MPGIRDYIYECSKTGVIPVSYFMRHVKDEKLVMRYRGLGPLGAKAIARPLEVNMPSLLSIRMVSDRITNFVCLRIAVACDDNYYTYSPGKSIRINVSKFVSLCKTRGIFHGVYKYRVHELALFCFFVYKELF